MLSFVVLVIQVWLFMILGLLLHRASPRFGLTPLLFYVATLMTVLNFAELMALHIEPVEGIVLRTGGHVFVPIILMIVLVLYVADGTHPAQLVIYSLTGINVLVLLVLAFLLLYQNVRDADTVLRGLLTEQNLITPEFLRGVVASLLTFLVDMFVIAVTYQGMRNAFPGVPVWIVIGLALLASLWTDAILFNLLYFVGTPNFITLLPGDVLAKTLAALIIWPPVAWYLTRIAPGLPSFVGTEGRPTLDLIFGTFGRITRTLEQLRVEFRESQVTYRQLTENISEMFWLADASDGLFYYLNPAFETVTGHSRAVFYRKPEAMFAIVHPEDRGRMSGSFRDYLLHTPQDEFRIVRPDGEIRWIRSRVFSLYNGQGDIYRLVGLAEDITERKQVEAREQALALEKGKVRLLREFIRDASHDLKTPLTSIKLKVELLHRAKDPADIKRHLGELENYADFLNALIDDLFTLSQLESGMVTTVGPQDIHQILLDVQSAVQPLAANKNLSLRFDLQHEENWQVTGDAAELNRAVTNLVSNAIRYCPAGGVEVRTRAGNTDSMIVEVQDTGIGIEVEELPHIFDRFYRARSARESGIEGTGLGLAIAKAIIDKHSGTIQVESRPGTGTLFRVTLPLVAGPAVVEDVPSGSELKPTV